MGQYNPTFLGTYLILQGIATQMKGVAVAYMHKWY